MLPRHSEAEPYAAYESRNHRRHITGLSLYSGLVCMPTCSQNAGVASSYIIVRRRPDWLERGAFIWELVIYLGRESSN